MRTADEINTSYVQLCAQLGAVEASIDELELKKVDLLHQIQEVKAEGKSFTEEKAEEKQ